MLNTEVKQKMRETLKKTFQSEDEVEGIKARVEEMLSEEYEEAYKGLKKGKNPTDILDELSNLNNVASIEMNFLLENPKDVDWLKWAFRCLVELININNLNNKQQ